MLYLSRSNECVEKSESVRLGFVSMVSQFKFNFDYVSLVSLVSGREFRYFDYVVSVLVNQFSPYVVLCPLSSEVDDLTANQRAFCSLLRRQGRGQSNVSQNLDGFGRKEFVTVSLSSGKCSKSCLIRSQSSQ